MVKRKKLKPDFIFETSWEVCNKVGGIYAVLSTRANTLRNLFEDRVIYVGPDLWKDAINPDFIESKTLLKSWKTQAAKEGLRVRVGRWNVPGKPIAVLVDFRPFYKEKGNIYFWMWEQYGIDSTMAYGDYDESCIFAYASARVIESLYNHHRLSGQKVVAHLNEWMLSMAALYLKKQAPEIATIFTTHATTVGRSIAGNNKPLYDQLSNYNGDQMACELNVQAKHTLEKRAAHQSDCFTTVSELTACECTQLLDKTPDVVTPNGFEDNFVPQGKDYDRQKKMARHSLIEVAEQLLGEEIASDAFLLATSGRYEYKNKGIDLFIEAVDRVRKAMPDRQIIAFILVPAWISGPRLDLQSRLKEDIAHQFPLYNPYYTHNLHNMQDDPVCEYLEHLHFYNQKHCKTKLIFVPSYLMGDDGIFNVSYYELLIGMDLTVFPSYYEPWGYTPLESIAFGIPTITTNLAGFGLWAKEQEAKENKDNRSVVVVDRTDHNYFDAAETIKENIIEYAELSLEKTNRTREAARLLSKKASWEYFVTYYLEAYDIALRRAELRTKKGMNKK